jgi:hypothetical protein
MLELTSILLIIISATISTRVSHDRFKSSKPLFIVCVIKHVRNVITVGSFLIEAISNILSSFKTT